MYATKRRKVVSMQQKLEAIKRLNKGEGMQKVADDLHWSGMIIMFVMRYNKNYNNNITSYYPTFSIIRRSASPFMSNKRDSTVL